MTNLPDRPETIIRLANSAPLALAMLAGMQLDLFTPLKDGPMTNQQLADTLSVSPYRLKPLLYALVAAGLLTLDGEWFSNTPEADHFLVRGKAGYIGWWHGNFGNNWGAIFKSASSIRTGQPQDKHDFSRMTQEQLDEFARRSYPRVAAAARDLLERYDFSRFRNLIDVGGGTGALAIAITEACPHLKATVVDQPNMTSLTQRFVAEMGAAERVRVVSTDVVKEKLEGSFDVAVMSAFLQVLSPQEAQQAVQNVGRVAEPGCSAFILGRGVVDSSRTAPPSGVAFSLFAMNAFEGGQAHTVQEHRDWLTTSGITADFEWVTLMDGTSIIRARKPE